jgi:hypothetical protein
VQQIKPIAGEVLEHSIDRDVVYDALLHRSDRGVTIECFVPVIENLRWISLVDFALCQS